MYMKYAYIYVNIYTHKNEYIYVNTQKGQI